MTELGAAALAAVAFTTAAANSADNIIAILVYSVVSFILGFMVAIAIHGRGSAAGGRDDGHHG